MKQAVKFFVVSIVILLMANQSRAQTPAWTMGFAWPSSPARLLAVLSSADGKTYSLSMCTKSSVMIKDCLAETTEVYQIKKMNDWLDYSRQLLTTHLQAEQTDERTQIKQQSAQLQSQQSDLQKASADYTKQMADIDAKLADPNLPADEKTFWQNAKEDTANTWQEKSQNLNLIIASTQQNLASWQKLEAATTQRIVDHKKENADFLQLFTKTQLEKYEPLKLPTNARTLERVDLDNTASYLFALLVASNKSQLKSFTYSNANFVLNVPANLVSNEYLVRVQFNSYWLSGFYDYSSSSEDRYPCSMTELRLGSEDLTPLAEFRATIGFGFQDNRSIMVKYYVVDETAGSAISPSIATYLSNDRGRPVSPRTCYRETRYSKITGSELSATAL